MHTCLLGLFTIFSMSKHSSCQVSEMVQFRVGSTKLRLTDVCLAPARGFSGGGRPRLSASAQLNCSQAALRHCACGFETSSSLVCLVEAKGVFRVPRITVLTVRVLSQKAAAGNASPASSESLANLLLNGQEVEFGNHLPRKLTLPRAAAAFSMKLLKPLRS